MAFVGGDITEIKYNHSVLGDGTIFCKSAEAGTMDIGGYRTADDAANVTGGGQMIQQISRVLASFEAPPISWDMTGADELQKLADMAASPILANWTISIISGAVYGGLGKPVGDLTADTMTAQVTLKLAFEGTLKQIT